MKNSEKYTVKRNHTVYISNTKLHQSATYQYICTFLSKCKTMHIYLVAFKVGGFNIIVVASFK